MERRGTGYIDPADPGEETDWPVPEAYRVGAPASPPALDERETTAVLAAPTPPRRRYPLRRLGISLVAALVLAVLLAMIAFTSTASDRSSEAGAARTGAALEVAATVSPQRASAVAPAVDRAATTEVPDVEGAAIAAARRALRAAGLKIETRQVESDRPSGVVLGQEPGAGERVARGSTIVIVVSDGAPTVAVPNVVRLRVDRAARLLRRAGLRVEIRLVRSSEQARVVVAQRPPEGASLRPSGLVRLSVAKGPSPAAAKVRVPSLVGLQLGAAKATLRARGLRWSTHETPSERAVGIVVGQSARAGAFVKKGTRVALDVSSGPQLHAVPDVVGLDVVLAREQLEAKGFVVLVTESPTTDPAEDGIVLDQSPGGATRLAEGSEITLFVGMAG